MLVPAETDPEIGQPGSYVVWGDGIEDFKPAVFEEVGALGGGEVRIDLGHGEVKVLRRF